MRKYNFTKKDRKELATHIAAAIALVKKNPDNCDGCWHLCFIDDTLGFFMGWQNVREYDIVLDGQIVIDGYALVAGLKDYRSDASMLTDYPWIDYPAIGEELYAEDNEVFYDTDPTELANTLIEDYYQYMEWLNSKKFDIFRVFSDGSRVWYTSIYSNNAKNALRKYVKNTTSTGFWSISKENDNWVASSSYGCVLIARRA